MMRNVCLCDVCTLAQVFMISFEEDAEKAYAVDSFRQIESPSLHR